MNITKFMVKTRNLVSSPLRCIAIALLFYVFVSKAEFNDPRAEIEVARREQEEFCTDPGKYRNQRIEELITMVKLNYDGIPFRMYVYKMEHMSNWIQQGKIWEYDNIKLLSSFLQNYMKSKNITDPAQVHVLDIGANMGMYTLVLGLQGYSVTAFEAMEENAYLLRKSLCLNPQINALVLRKPLGDSHKRCKLYSLDEGFSNGKVLCDGISPPKNLTFRYDFDIYPLSYFAPYLKDVVAMKLDVEGLEYRVLRGGRKVLFDPPIPFMQIEFVPEALSDNGDDPKGFIAEFLEKGYTVYNPTIGIMDRLTSKNMKSLPNCADCWFVHKSAYEMSQEVFNKNTVLGKQKP